MSPVGDEIRGFLGMRVDPERRVLWANWHQGNSSEGYDPEAPHWTGISKYNLDDGSLIREYAIAKTDDNHLFNDVAIAGDGSVDFTSFAHGVIYRIDSGTDEIEEYLRMPEDVWNNGIDMTPDESFCLLSATTGCSGSTWKPTNCSSFPLERASSSDGVTGSTSTGTVSSRSPATGEKTGESSTGLSGCSFSEELDRVTGIDVLDEDHPLYASPTTGALVDDWFYYIATAQFGKFDEDGDLAPWDELSDTYILKLNLRS